MFRYTGKEFERIYLSKKCKRQAWRAYLSKNDWLTDFEDLRELYADLFARWHDESAWEESDTFIDSHY